MKKIDAGADVFTRGIRGDDTEERGWDAAYFRFNEVFSAALNERTRNSMQI